MATAVVTGGDGTSPTSKAASPNGSTAEAATWRQDPMAAAVLRAFMLGWTITELRSRIVIASDLTLRLHPQHVNPAPPTTAPGAQLAATAEAPAPDTAATAPAGTAPPAAQADRTGQTEAPAPDTAATAPAGTSEAPPAAQADRTGQTEAPAPDTAATAPAGTAPPAAQADRTGQTFDDALWNTSVWRAIFNRIATIHATVFGDSSTANTIYQPEGGWRSIEELACLFPEAAPAYSDVGVFSATFSDQTSGHTVTFDRFTLYDVTRRALNCLGLLHMGPEPANRLLDESIKSYTGDLITQMGALIAHRLDAQAAVNQYTAIEAMTAITSELLAAWESFVREHYYNGGSIPNDPHEQQAFEAGAAMAALSWQLTQDTSALRPDDAAGTQTAVPARLYKAWTVALAPRSTAYIAHQLTGLGAILDEAYYAHGPKQRPDPTAGGKPPFDPYLPSQALSCVTASMGFWRKALRWLDPDEPQAGQAAHALTPPLERALWEALVEQATLWQALITGEQHLDVYGVETVMHRVVEEVVTQFRDDVAAQLKGSLRDTLTAALRQLAPVALVLLGLSIPGILWLLLTRPDFAGALNPNGLWAVIGAGPILASLFGFRAVAGTLKSSPTASASVTTAAPADAASAAPSSPLVAHLQGVLGSVDTTLLKMLENASEQIQRDLAAMNHAIGVSYPLLDCLIEYPLLQTVTTDFTFMSQVIWSQAERTEEVEGVVRAALGPIGLLVDEHLAEAMTSTTGMQAAEGAQAAPRTTSRLPAWLRWRRERPAAAQQVAQ